MKKGRVIIMKKRKYLKVLGFIVIISLLAAACSKKSDSATTANFSEADISYDKDSGGNLTAMMQAGAPAAATDTEDKSSGSGLMSTMGSSSVNSTLQTQDKIIRTFNMDVETQEFDDLVNRIEAEISRLGGYVESSQVSGKRYYYTDEARYGNIIARIPSEKVDEFVTVVGDNANVVNKQESTDNVSLDYIEAESRIETLKIEQERLFAILEKEASLENIITLESRLSEIRYELQNYESQLRYYDNQVAYSTVTMNLQEVEKFTPVTETKQSVGTRIKNGFSNTIFNISEGFKNFFVWFIVNLPYLLIWAIVIFVIVFIIRKSMKKNKSRAVVPPLPPIIPGPQNMGTLGPGQINSDNSKQE
jgi:hypothetical protein